MTVTVKCGSSSVECQIVTRGCPHSNLSIIGVFVSLLLEVEPSLHNDAPTVLLRHGC